MVLFHRRPPFITEDTTIVSSTSTQSLTNTVNLSVTTAPAQIGLSPGNLGSDTNGTSNDAQGERFFQLMNCLLLVVLFLLSRDTTSSRGTISPRGINSSRDTTSSRGTTTCGTTSSCGTTPSRDITPSCVATSSLGANGLPPPVRGLIYPPRDEPVPSRQSDPAHVSNPATVTSHVMAPTPAPISPSTLAATRFRDTHGSVKPPDPPWTATTTSLISPTKEPEQGVRLPLPSLWHTIKPHLDGSMLSSGPLFYAKDSQNQAVTATGKLLVSGVVKSVLFDTGAKRSCMATDTAARMLQRGRARVVNFTCSA